jgi:hypothetical protein
MSDLQQLQRYHKKATDATLGNAIREKAFKYSQVPPPVYLSCPLHTQYTPTPVKALILRSDKQSDQAPQENRLRHEQQ